MHALPLALVFLLPLAARAEDLSGNITQTAQSEAWGLYEQAFADAAAGRDDMALLGLEELQRRFPGTGASLLGLELKRLVAGRAAGSAQAMSTALRARLEDLAPPAKAPAPSVEAAVAAAEKKRYGSLAEALRDEQPNNGSRAELVLAQTLHGVVLGVEAVGALELSGPQPVAAATLLGAGAMAGLSLLYSRDGVTAGQALAINSGTAWGAWHGLLLPTVISDRSYTNQFLMAGQLVGAVAGHFAWSGLGLAAGDVALMNSTALYAGTATLIGLSVFGINGFTAGTLNGVLLAVTDLGLVAGYLLSRQYPLGRGRVLVMDVGALLGGLLGSSVVFLASFNGQAALVGGLLGGAGGIAASLYVTRNWDLEWAGIPVQVGLAPTQHGGGQLAVSGSF